jgi:hypothetical protein
MFLFRLIGYCIAFFKLTSHLNAQLIQPITPNRDIANEFSLIPLLKTFTEGLSNIVPPRGGIAEPSTAQLSKFKKYYKLSCTAYCNSVSGRNHWNCKNCLESVPDGVLVSTFTDYIYDVCGFVLRSDHDKAIYLVFRGSVSVTNFIWVSPFFFLLVYSLSCLFEKKNSHCIW